MRGQANLERNWSGLGQGLRRARAGGDATGARSGPPCRRAVCYTAHRCAQRESSSFTVLRNASTMYDTPNQRRMRLT